MDDSLFLKYKKEITKQKTKKQEIISFIEKESKIKLKESEIEIKGKKIFFIISSTQKAILFKNKIQEKIKTKGYSI